MSTADEDAPEPPRESAPSDRAPPVVPPPTPGLRLPRAQMAIAGIAGVLIIVVNLVLIQSGLQRDDGPGASAVASASARLARSQVADVAALDLPAPQADAGAPTVADEPAPDDEPPAPDPAHRTKTKGHTVQWAAERACSTAHIDGLSRQIIEEARRLDANAFASVPPRRNLSSANHVFLYLDAPARDHLLRALDAHPDRTMKVHSALRTVAQQYLLSRWAAGKRCGIQLATRPGESNHESGLALDVGASTAWRSALESEGFHWLGSIDRVHFDFVGAGTTHHDGLDVRAFQRLWNRNNPDDAIAETGHYDGATEQRLKRSPAGGFPIGARRAGKEDRLASGGNAHVRRR